jgi:hypothetical protein
MAAHVILLLSLLLAGAGNPAENVQTIIQKSVEANARDWAASPSYECLEKDQDGEGSKTYKDLMIEGSPYQELVEINGKPLPKARKQQEERKMQRTIAERRNESKQKRAQRLAKYEKERKRDQIMFNQMAKAFDFKLSGEQKLDGRDVYVMKAVPRKGYRPPNMQAQVLKGMEGQLWIDKQTYQWVKVEVHVIHPVSIEGFLAQVEPGTRFELEKAPVDQDIWLAKHYVMQANAKILHMFNHNSQEDDTYYEYRKMGVEAQKGGS